MAVSETTIEEDLAATISRRGDEAHLSGGYLYGAPEGEECQGSTGETVGLDSRGSCTPSMWRPVAYPPIAAARRWV